MDQNSLSLSYEVAQSRPEIVLPSEDAPALSSAPSLASSTQQKHPPSCNTCRRRKVKCDRADPCSQCVRAGAICVFSPRSGVPRGRKGGRRKLDRELLDRVAKLENLLKDFEGKNTAEAATLPSLDSGNRHVGHLDPCTC
jgi:hypothetical protein